MKVRFRSKAIIPIPISSYRHIEARFGSLFQRRSLSSRHHPTTSFIILLIPSVKLKLSFSSSGVKPVDSVKGL